MFTDVEGAGGTGAVLVTEDLEGARFRRGHIPEAFGSLLCGRRTQIVPYELAVPAAAVHGWRNALRGKKVVIYVDNNSALGILHRGRSPKKDLNLLARISWSLFFELDITPFFRRVPSAFNCADPPSRGQLAPFGSIDTSGDIEFELFL